MTAPNLPTFVDPSFGEAGPSMAELEGRFVAILPLSINYEAAGYDPGTKTSAVTFDLYVLDGGELQYGAAPKKSRPATDVISVPAYFRAQINSNDNIVRALAPHVGQGKAVLGVIKRSTVGPNFPWLLVALEPNDQKRQLAAQIFGAIAAGTYKLPEPRTLAGNVQAIQPQQPVYAPQPQAQQFAPQPQAAPVATPWGPPAAQPAQAPWPPAAPMGTQPAQQYTPAPAQAAPIEPAPPGIDPQMWAQMSPEQRQILAQQFAAMTQANGAPPAQAGPPANPWG